MHVSACQAHTRASEQSDRNLRRCCRFISTGCGSRLKCQAWSTLRVGRTDSHLNGELPKSSPRPWKRFYQARRLFLRHRGTFLIECTGSTLIKRGEAHTNFNLCRLNVWRSRTCPCRALHATCGLAWVALVSGYYAHMRTPYRSLERVQIDCVPGQPTCGRR